jgi:uncharacterized membrane protein YfcA
MTFDLSQHAVVAPPLTLGQGLLLGLTAAVAAAINSVAGGGTFLTFPVLIFCGFTEFRANTTSTVALWFGSVASVRAYQSQLKGQRRPLVILLTTSLLGALLGSLLLLKTPDSVFQHLVPWLLLFATLTFIYGKSLTRLLHRYVHLDITQPQNWGPFFVGIAIQLVIAVYGGFFGGGIGILILALLTLLGYIDIHAMNGLKTVLQTSINAIAVVIFIIAGVVNWPQAAVMIVGSVAGGYWGAWLAQRISPQNVRRGVVVIASSITAYFFLREWLLR